MDLFEHELYPVLTLEKGTKGEAYTLKKPCIPWSWRRMLNGMDDMTLDRIIGDGIIGITCQAIPNTSDHKRLRAARKEKTRILMTRQFQCGILWSSVVTAAGSASTPA